MFENPGRATAPLPPAADAHDRMHCFSMQVVMNKCFLLNQKKLAQIRLVIFEKNAKHAPLIPKNDITDPKTRLL